MIITTFAHGTALAFAKLIGIWMARKGIMIKQNFHQILNTMEKLLAKWASGPHLAQNDIVGITTGQTLNSNEY